MAEQRASCAWYLDIGSGETKAFALKPGHLAWVTHAVLVDPESAAAGQSVAVRARSDADDQITTLLLSPERPVALVPSPATLELDDMLWLERDDDDSAADSLVRVFGGSVTAPAPEETQTDDHRETAAVEDGREDAEAADRQVPLQEEEAGTSIIGDTAVRTLNSVGWYVDLESGESAPFILKPGERAWVSHAELVNPWSAAPGQTVRVTLHTKTGDVQSLTLWAERNVVMLQSTVMLEEDFWLEREEDEPTDVIVRFIVCDGNVHPIPEIVEYQAEGYEDEESYEYDDISDDDGAYDTEDEEEEDEKSEVASSIQVAVAAADSTEIQEQEEGGERQILVLYRYTRFTAAGSDGSVAPRGSTREHHLRYIAAAGLGASSLAWVGASLAHMIYPNGLRKKLREIWTTNLASKVSCLPPGAARIKVVVDVGILRPENCTHESMGYMRAVLEDIAPWPTNFLGMVLNLPEPMRCAAHDHEDNESNDTAGGEQRPAKRRRTVAAGDECSICFDRLEGDDIAAWPGCGKPHVFHGRCLERAMESNPFCPICRRGLYIAPTF